MKKMGLSGSSMFGGYGSGSSLSYYCMSCGTKHNQSSMSQMWFKDEKSRILTIPSRKTPLSF